MERESPRGTQPMTRPAGDKPDPQPGADRGRRWMPGLVGDERNARAAAPDHGRSWKSFRSPKPEQDQGKTLPTYE